MRTIPHPSPHVDHGPTAFTSPADASLDRWGELLIAEPGLAECDRAASKGGDWRHWLGVVQRLLALCSRREELRREGAYRAAHEHLLSRFERANGGGK